MKLKKENKPLFGAYILDKAIYIFLTLLFSCFFGFGQLPVANIAVTDGAAGETSGTANPGNFRITFGTGLSLAKTVNVVVEPASTAQAGADRASIPGVYNLPASATFLDIPVTGIVDDNLVEGDETVILTILAGTGYTLPPVAQRTETITIQDNDVGVFTVDTTVGTDSDANEQTPATAASEGRFVVRLDKENGTGATVTLPYTLSGTATNGGASSDYTTTGQATFTFLEGSPGTTARALSIIPIDDVISESDETVILTLGTPSNALFSVANQPVADRTVTIEDNDCPAGALPPALNNNATAFCDQASVNLNTFVVGGTGSAPTGAALRWTTDPTPTVAGDLLASATVSASDTYYAVYYSSSQTCFSPVSDALPITFNDTPDPGTPVANLTSCNDNTFGTTTFDLDNGLTGEDSGGTWTYQSGPGNPGIGGGNVVNFNNDGSGTYVFRYTLTGTAPCTNQFEEITISVTDCDPCLAGDAAPVLNAGVDTTFCDDITVSLSDYTSSTPPDSNSVLRWSTDSDLENTSAHLSSAEVNATLTLAGTYYAFFWDAANTCASPALVVNVILNDTPIVSNAQAETRCGPGPVTFTATVSGNPTISWYTQMTGGTVAGTGASFTDDLTQTTTYYVEATENGCASSPRIEVTGTVVPQPSAGVPTDTSSCNDPEFGVTTLNLNEQLAGEDPGVWAFTSGPANIAPGTGSIDFINQPDGIYVFTYTTTGAEAPCEDESASVTVSVSSCDTDDDGDGLFGGTEQALGTDPQNADTDGDGIDDGIEVGADLENPLDSDVDSDGNPSPDGVIDALDSNILDEDNDGIVDQLDPGNDNPCVPTRENSVCNFDGDDFFDFEEIANGTNPDDPCDPDPLSDACQPIDLEVTKVVDNEFAVVGDRVVFTVTINNLEDRRAGNIIIGDLLETGFEYVSHNASAGTYTVDTGEWQLFELPASSSETLEVTVDIIEGGVYTNTAELLSSLPEDSNAANNSATVQIAIDLPEGINLVVEKTARLGPDKQRKSKLTGLINDVDNEVEVEYFIKVINKSISESVSNIRVQDTFTGQDGAVFEIMEAVVPSGTTFDSVARVWTIESLAVNAEIELSYKVVFRSVGIFVNSAEVIRSAPPESIADDADSKSEVEVEITTRNVVDIGIIFNQFSPNDDGINDDLKINRIRKNADGIDELVEIAYNINIFNRYGNLVFEANDMTEEKVWDGTWKGKEVPEGTYFYILNIAIENESSKIAKGWIQLIR